MLMIKDFEEFGEKVKEKNDIVTYRLIVNRIELLVTVRKDIEVRGSTARVFGITPIIAVESLVNYFTSSGVCPSKIIFEMDYCDILDVCYKGTIVFDNDKAEFSARLVNGGEKIKIKINH